MISEVVMKINQKEKDMRREKILDVAFRLFVDQKIESVTSRIFSLRISFSF